MNDPKAKALAATLVAVAVLAAALVGTMRGRAEPDLVGEDGATARSSERTDSADLVPPPAEERGDEDLREAPTLATEPAPSLAAVAPAPVTLEELERVFEEKYAGKDRFLLKAYYDAACLERLALARPLLEEKMQQGLFEEYAPVGEEGFNVTAHVPNMTENPMVMNVMIPLGDGRTVPRVVRLEPDETPEIFRAHAEAKWLKDRVREMTRKERAERVR